VVDAARLAQVLGSIGCQLLPACPFRQLAEKSSILCVVGKLPTSARKLPALPSKKNGTRQTLGSQRQQRCCGIGILPMFVHGLEVRATHLTNDSALGLVDELDDLRDLFARRQFLSDRFERLARVVFRSID